jgi:hypothetical protein
MCTMMRGVVVPPSLTPVLHQLISLNHLLCRFRESWPLLLIVQRG